MNLNETIQFIKTKTNIRPDLGFILGSGLGDFADQIENKTTIPFSDIPGFKKPHVAGHSGELVIGRLHKKNVVALKGRVHFYEGHSTEEVVYPVRTLVKLGVKTLVVTNSAGGLKATTKPGSFMIITDHINLTGQNPLIGKNNEELGPRFPDMSQTYTPHLIKKLELAFKKLKIPNYKSIYVGVSGPTYETPAEIKFFQKIGGGAVGMSTVMEVIAARHMGVEIAGVSCITNLGSGLSKKPLNHKEVTDVARKATQNFCRALSEFTKSL